MKTGRFLCVREELRRKIEEEEADESELQSSWLSRLRMQKRKIQSLLVRKEMLSQSKYQILGAKLTKMMVSIAKETKEVAVRIRGPMRRA